MKNSIMILSIIFFSVSCYSQDWFSTQNLGDKIPGYILGMDGDTIEGYIKYDYPIVMQKRIFFFPPEIVSNPIIYAPENIWEYALLGKKWISTTVIMNTYDGRYKFRRFGILESDQGPLKLLRIFDETDKLKKKTNSEAEKEFKNIYFNFPKNSLNQLYIQKIEGEAELLNSKEFKKSFISKMNSYVGDHKELLQKIESRKYTLEHIFIIVSEYNEWFKSKVN